MSYDIIPVHEHLEIYINGNFYCTADNWIEAEREIKEYKEERIL